MNNNYIATIVRDSDEEVHRSYSMPGGVIVLLIFMVVLTVVIIHLKNK